jgi:hypothetical protein
LKVLQNVIVEVFSQKTEISEKVLSLYSSGEMEEYHTNCNFTVNLPDV